MNARALVAEFIGTFTLVLSIVGAALLAAPSAGLVAVALAAGIAVVVMTYAVGHVSGGHFNPAVTVGLWASGRFDSSKAPGYIVAQVAGGAVAACVLAIVLGGSTGGRWNTFAGASNHYAPIGSFGFLPSFLLEVLLTALLVVVVVGTTARRAPAGFAPLAIGLAMALFYVVAIPVTNGSLNPARSTATAIFGGAGAIAQLWAFWVAPIIGGVVGGVVGRYLQEE
ncbi:MAG: aquaporin [Hyphomicrobiaceae bacterium]|nr:aquaporin [Hyphomicrobiaceae bacterium]